MSGLIGALSFLTRLPLKSDEEALRNSPSWFATAGAFIGLAPALLWYFLPSSVGLFLALALFWGLTGGLHLDGWADTCDGLLSGKRGEALQAVMKDSRIGAFGALGLGLVLLGSFVALNQLGDITPLAPLALIGGPLISRPVAVATLHFTPYPGGLAAPFAGGSTKKALLFNGLTIGAAALATLWRWPEALFPLAMATAAGWLSAAFLLCQACRKAGRLCGDFLGAALTLTELVFWLTSAVIP